MWNKTVAAMAVLAMVALVSGCMVRHYVVEKDRVDQDLAAGNQGYLNGTVPETLTPQERPTTRPTYVTEIELPIFGKRKAPAPQTPATVEEEASTAVTSEEAAAEYVSAPETPTQFEKYTVQNSDTLEKISKKFYGKARFWTRIYDANKDTLKGPDKIYPGKVLNIPVDKLREPAENLK